ncbi:MAG TPA: type VI secretion system-associated FHA domain protein TagH [Steroidobacteraceae bacterium]|nr:type VI secretion system-associated FHA domain protein TagH [Steroidobacteraceae bacterium]
MALKLRVISEQYQQLGKLGMRMFGVTGGRIGRAPDNDWALPDPDRYISSHHAAVHFRAGKWILEDTSTNGVFVNNSEIPLAQQGPWTLKDGDRIRMGDYDILVSIDDRQDFPMDSSVGTAASATVAQPKPRAARSRRDHDHDNLNAELDINALLGAGGDDATRFAPPSLSTGRYHVGNAFAEATPAPAPAQRPAARAVVPARKEADPDNSGLYENIPLTPPPSVVAAQPDSASGAAEDWHLRTRRYQKAPQGLVPNAPAKSERGQSGDFQGELNAGVEAFCRGLGVDPSALHDELPTTTLTLAGQMLREVVLALMEALKARGEFKGRFDPNQTGAQSAQNNPLKNATAVDDAVRKLLDAHNTRYLGPVESLRDAFNDLKTHQTAVTSGMHAGINGLMQRINPAELQDRFERNLKRAGANVSSNKAKYWDLYAEFFQVLNQRNNDGLPLSFHEDFVQTYIERVNGFRAGKRR